MFILACSKKIKKKSQNNMTTPTSLSFSSESWLSQDPLNGDSVEYLHCDVPSLVKPSVQARQTGLLSYLVPQGWNDLLSSARAGPTLCSF